MNRYYLRQPIALPLMLTAAALFSSCTPDWPQFRGPDADMIVSRGSLPEEWGMDHNIRWTTEVGGQSWSCPVVWGDRIFVATAVAEKVSPPVAGDRPSGREGEADLSFRDDIYRWEVSCMDLETGTEHWRKVAYRGNPRIQKHRATNYAAETPVTDGRRVYVYFGMTGVYCYELDGTLVWEKDLGAYRTQNDWGTGSSPLLYKDRLYIQNDNEEESFLVALDPETGEELWRVDRDEKTNYSTPFIWENPERTELVTCGKKARSYDPETGELYWELYMAGRYSIPSPVAGREMLYLGNAGFRDIPGTFFAVKAGAEGDISLSGGESSSEFVAWSDRDAPTGNPSPLLYNGLLYILSSRGGELTCLDPATGETVYREKIEGVGACWASPWAHGDKIFFYDERGTTRVIRAGRQFELLHENSLEGKFWSSIAATRSAYLIKGVKTMYCVGE